MKKGFWTAVALGTLSVLYMCITAVATFGNVGTTSFGTLYQPEVPESMRRK